MHYLVTTREFHGHSSTKSASLVNVGLAEEVELTYIFHNHFHPFVGELLEQLNTKAINGLLDVRFHAQLTKPFFDELYGLSEAEGGPKTPNIQSFPKEIDVSENGSYSVYNWELLFHAPLTIAVHLSKNQRFAEAQRWFHYIFDPTSNDKDVDAPKRFWRFLRFRQNIDITQIDELLEILSKPPDECTAEELELKKRILSGYDKIREHPFQPHVVARTRYLAYQYCVVMKYLDNLIAWGDSLFRQDTIETINEATQLYVLAANLLGPKPQRVPPRGTIRPKTFAQLRANGLDPLGNALVELEGQFPFNLHIPTTRRIDTDNTNVLFGIGRALYFCIPRNDKLLSYWDVVADRLFKIRHCMSIEGVVRQLPLFEPPIDPGMLVKAAAAGIDVSSLVSGLNQPLAPVRSALLIQKALELCNEVRGMGANLLAVLEKRDAEAVALLRQKHEISIQQMVQDVRYLQWKEAEEATASLVKSRESAVERYRFYQRLLGDQVEEIAERTDFNLERRELTEENFDQVYGELVGQYGQALELEHYPSLEVPNDNSPSRQSGASGPGRLHLNTNEHAELNEHVPNAKEYQAIALGLRQLAPALALIPDFPINLHYWGIGGTIVFGGPGLSSNAVIGADVLDLMASRESHDANSASKTASYERRADEWMFQSNLAARDLMQIGRQIISSLIREQITRHEYENLKKQIEQAEEIDRVLREKFTSAELYAWMQGELCKLYYECYKFAFDIARKAEQTMKHELMRPELDAMSIIKFNYWDGGRKGLLSGETLYLDLKRLEMAYHDHNKREYELTKHVSLRQLDPVALLTLKATGSCEFTLPEWLFDLDGPGHYMRRIKNVSLSIPAVAGPYTGINCTLSLLKSSLRRSPLLREGDKYQRIPGEEDTRFVDYYGTIQSIITSNAQNDSGMFEPNLRDDRFLPFEGAGAESTWRLELPSEFPQFDYDSIPDVILHLRYTARPGGDVLRQKAVQRVQELPKDVSTFAQMFSLRHDFPSEWQRFVGGHDSFNVTLRKEFFPYLVQAAEVTVDRVIVCAITGNKVEERTLEGDWVLEEPGGLELSIQEDATVLIRDNKAQIFLVVSYGLGSYGER